MSKPLKIFSKNFLPEVVLDKDNGIFTITGKSIPEDSSEFYAPVFNWFNDYFEAPNSETVLVFRLDYYNSSSARAIANLMKLLDNNFVNKNTNVKVVWEYNSDDEAMKESGEDFSMLFSLPIEIKAF